VHQSIVRAEATPVSQALLLSLAAPEGGIDAICIFAWCNEGDNVPDGIQVPPPAAHTHTAPLTPHPAPLTPHPSPLTPTTPTHRARLRVGEGSKGVECQEPRTPMTRLQAHVCWGRAGRGGGGEARKDCYVPRGNVKVDWCWRHL